VRFEIIKYFIIIKTRMLRLDYGDAINSAISAQLEYVDNLPREILTSLHNYTQDEYKKINKIARDLPEEFDPEKEEIENDDLKNIERAFIHVPPLTESITVYRGIRTKRDTSIYDVKYYLSTSADIDRVIEFVGCCMLKINIQSGCKILPLMKVSNYAAEKEILIQRNVTFIVSNFKYAERGDVSFEQIDVACIPKSSVKMNLESPISKVHENIVVSKTIDDVVDITEEAYLNGEIDDIDLRFHLLDRFENKLMEKEIYINYEDDSVDSILDDMMSRLSAARTMAMRRR
jgi:hypothetical protein